MQYEKLEQYHKTGSIMYSGSFYRLRGDKCEDAHTNVCKERGNP